MTKLISMVLCGLFLFSSGAFPKNEVGTDTFQVDLFTYTDFLGNLEPSDYAPGAAAFKSVIDRERAKNPDGSILVCVGDVISGTPIANLVHGESVIKTMNATGHDALVIGNHEFDWGPEVLKEALRKAEFPILTANIYEPATEGELFSGAQPYLMIERHGIKIGILGLTTASTPSIIRKEYADALAFKNNVEIAKETVPKMRAEGAQIIVLAGHLPLYIDDAAAEVYHGELYDIVTQVPGIDVAFGGHNDDSIATVINNVYVAKSNFYGTNLAHASLRYDKTLGRIVSASVDLVPATESGLTPDAEIESIVDEYGAEINEIFEQVIGEASTDLEHDYFYEDAIGNWFSNAVKNATGADMAFINQSGVFESVQKGPITLRKLYQMSPFENELVILDMTGAQLLELWETTLLEERMPEYGTLAFSGLQITYDSRKEDGNKVISLSLPSGEALSPDAIYTVATLDFLAGGGNGYTLLTGLPMKQTGIMMRDAYVEEMKAMGTLTPDLIGWMTDVNR